MNNKHIWILLWILSSTKIFAQVGQNPPPNICNDIVRTTNPTINVWDWRTPTWEVYVAGYFNPPVNVVTSPFFSCGWYDINHKREKCIKTLEAENAHLKALEKRIAALEKSKN